MTSPHFVDPPPPAQTARLAELGLSASAWATAAKVTVGLTMVSTAGTAATSYALIRAWNAFDAGTTDFSELVNTESTYVNAGLVYLVVQVVAYVVVITWLYKSAKNAERINPGRMNNKAKWAIWGWFVPFMNLARPYHMVKETWEASNRGDTTPTPVNLFRAWWGLLLVSSVVFRISFGADATDVYTILYSEIVGDVLYLAAGVVFIKIIGMIEQRQAAATLHPNLAPAPTMPAYVLPEANQIIS